MSEWRTSLYREGIPTVILPVVFIVDLLARGVKDTHYQFNVPEDEFFYNIDESLFEEADYSLVHNIIYGAVTFADEHGFKPHKDFAITEYILEEDTDAIELVDIEFGIDGEPAFVAETDSDEYVLEDFESFTDDDWRAYLSREANTESYQEATDVLFEKMVS